MEEEKPKTPDFFTAAETRKSFKELEESYFKVFDDAVASGIPAGYQAARMKDIIRIESDGDEDENEAKFIHAQVDYMLMRWQIIRNYK